MTGAGTKADPYIIMTVNDLYSMSSTGDQGIYYKLGADIDFNGTPYADNFSSITLKCAEVDGDGHAIRNIFIHNVSSSVSNIFYVHKRNSGSVVLKNICFENIFVDAEDINIFSLNSQEGSLELKSCVFLLNIVRKTTNESPRYNNSIFRSSYGNVSMDLCTFSVRGSMKRVGAVLSAGMFRRSHIHLDLDIERGSSEANQELALFVNESFSDSYITGSVRYGDNTYNKFIADSNCDLDNSYFALDIAGAGTIYSSAVYSAPCFYDAQLLENTVIAQYPGSSDSFANLHALTTAQCKDAEYLLSIGFICAGDE